MTRPDFPRALRRVKVSVRHSRAQGPRAVALLGTPAAAGDEPEQISDWSFRIDAAISASGRVIVLLRT